MPFSFNFASDDIDVDVDVDGADHGDVHMHDAPALDTSTDATAQHINADVDVDTGADADASEKGAPDVPVVHHGLDELLSALPSQISYNTIHLPAPATTSAPTVDQSVSQQPSPIRYSSGQQNKNFIALPRRPLFDIKLQLAAEDDPTFTSLSSTDLQTRVYEGGFKAWEGAADLVDVLAGVGAKAEGGNASDVESVEEKEVSNQKEKSSWTYAQTVIELGCGVAVPTCWLFALTLREAAAAGRVDPGRFNSKSSVLGEYGQPQEGSKQSETQQQAQKQDSKRKSFILADYNANVLRLVTLPNLILVWASWAGYLDAHSDDEAESRVGTDQSTQQVQSSRQSKSANVTEEGDLPLTPQLLEHFTQDLQALDLHLHFISGPWGEGFVELARASMDEAQSIVHESSSVGRVTAGLEGTSLSTVPLEQKQGQHSREQQQQHRQEEAEETQAQTLILASETLYSPASLAPFTSTVLSLLEHEPEPEHAETNHAAHSNSTTNSNNTNTDKLKDEGAPTDTNQTGKATRRKSNAHRALIASKRMYFGVGGGVDDFVQLVRAAGALTREVGHVQEGVGRVVLEVGAVSQRYSNVVN